MFYVNYTPIKTKLKKKKECNRVEKSDKGHNIEIDPTLKLHTLLILSKYWLVSFMSNKWPFMLATL